MEGFDALVAEFRLRNPALEETVVSAEAALFLKGQMEGSDRAGYATRTVAVLYHRPIRRAPHRTFEPIAGARAINGKPSRRKRASAATACTWGLVRHRPRAAIMEAVPG